MSNALLLPPLAFILFLLISASLSKITGLVAAKGKEYQGKTKAYACGENVPIHRSQPEYGQFFPFAFFFTIMHVVALIVATVPSGMTGMSILYLIVAVLSILILFRR